MAPTRASRDEQFMERAIALAKRGLGRVEPNPMVGCVIVRKGVIIGEGYHRRFGGPHAEVEALRRVTASPKGATVYVTLEPCSHFGKTPPCVNALIEARVGRVVAAIGDPFSAVNGKGFRRLRAAGIRVDVGCIAGQVRELNKTYLTIIRRKRPFIYLKWAQSVDGGLVTPGNRSRKISGEQSHRWVHRFRSRLDGIIVGIETVRRDDPQLTARYVKSRRTAARIVLDTRLRISPTCKLVETAREVPTVVITSRASIQSRDRRSNTLRRGGIELMECPTVGGRINLPCAMSKLAQKGMANIMVEGGPTVLSKFLRQRLADEAYVFVAPCILGGSDHRVIFDKANELAASTDSRRIGCDTLFHFRFTDPAHFGDRRRQ